MGTRDGLSMITELCLVGEEGVILEEVQINPTL